MEFFIETRLRQLKQHFPDVEIKVIAPIPWFPFTYNFFGSYASLAKAPRYENRFGIDVYHPRFFVLPKIGMTLTPKTLSIAIYKKAKELIEDGFNFDLIDGHYFYPDGVAIAKIAKKLSKPFTVTARGSDINFLPKFSRPKKEIQKVLSQAEHKIAVCEALKQEMIYLGATANSITTLRNGVDLKLFSFTDELKQSILREKLGLPIKKEIIISVGHLIERKGHHIVLDSLRYLPHSLLLIAGSGVNQKKLNALVIKFKLQKRVIFLGDLTQEQLARYYGAANVLVLASSREGWANVLLESMACGTPVIATNIWGTPEVVKSKEAGLLVERDSKAISEGLKLLLSHPPKRKETRQYAEQFNWYATSLGQYQIFSTLVKSTPISINKIQRTKNT